MHPKNIYLKKYLSKPQDVYFINKPSSLSTLQSVHFKTLSLQYLVIIFLLCLGPLITPGLEDICHSNDRTFFLAIPSLPKTQNALQSSVYINFALRHHLLQNLVVSLPGKTCVACLLLFFKIFKVGSKQEVDMPQIQNCVTRYSSPYQCSVPNIRKLACVVPEKNVTEIILSANLPMSTIFKVA